MITTVTMNDEDDHVSVWTCRPVDFRRLSKDKRWTCVASGTFGDGTPWGRFQIAKSEWTGLGGTKHRRVMTDEQRAEAAAWFTRTRQNSANRADEPASETNEPPSTHTQVRVNGEGGPQPPTGEGSIADQHVREVRQ